MTKHPVDYYQEKGLYTYITCVTTKQQGSPFLQVIPRNNPITTMKDEYSFFILRYASKFLSSGYKKTYSAVTKNLLFSTDNTRLSNKKLRVSNPKPMKNL